MLSWEFMESSKNVFSYRTPLVAASAKLTGKHQCDSSFLKKGSTLLKKRFWDRYFPLNYVKNTIFTELRRWLLLLWTPCKLSFVIMGIWASLGGEGNGCCRSTQRELGPTFPSCLSIPVLIKKNRATHFNVIKPS